MVHEELDWKQSEILVPKDATKEQLDNISLQFGLSRTNETDEEFRAKLIELYKKCPCEKDG